MSATKRKSKLTAIIEAYKARHSPNIPDINYRHRLEGLMSELAILRTQEFGFRFKENSNYFRFYNYVILNPLKPGRFRYVCPSGKIVSFKYEVFYVGKGRGNRAYTHLFHARNTKNKSQKCHTIRKIWKAGKKPRIIIMPSRVSDFMAMAFEIDLIAGIGRCDKKQGPLANLTDGGDGASGTARPESKLRYNGITRSLSEWSIETKIPLNTIISRQYRGWKVADILNINHTPRYKGSTSRTFLTKDGVTLSLVEWSERLNIKYNTLVCRRRNGWSVEEILKPF